MCYIIDLFYLLYLASIDLNYLARSGTETEIDEAPYWHCEKKKKLTILTDSPCSFMTCISTTSFVRHAVPHVG